MQVIPVAGSCNCICTNHISAEQTIRCTIRLPSEGWAWPFRLQWRNGKCHGVLECHACSIPRLAVKPDMFQSHCSFLLTTLPRPACSQIFLVFVIHLPDTHFLHILGHDGCGPHTQHPSVCCAFQWLLYTMVCGCLSVSFQISASSWALCIAILQQARSMPLLV